ncbi:AMP-binding enzyme, partial [Nocardia sp. NPDC003345]
CRPPPRSPLRARPDVRVGRGVGGPVVPVPGTTPTLDDLRDHVLAELDAVAAPRDFALVDEIPLLGPGKPDRAGLRRTLLAGSAS